MYYGVIIPFSTTLLDYGGGLTRNEIQYARTVPDRFFFTLKIFTGVRVRSDYRDNSVSVDPLKRRFRIYTITFFMICVRCCTFFSDHVVFVFRRHMSHSIFFFHARPFQYGLVQHVIVPNRFVFWIREMAVLVFRVRDWARFTNPDTHGR